VGERKLRIEVPDKGQITAIHTPADGKAADRVFIYAPGAGANLHDPFGVYACRTLASRGCEAVRFQFPYMEAGKRGPDRPPVLEATWRAAIEAARPLANRIVVGGRSMGGRIASQVVAQGVRVDGLALFAYPLHAPSKPDIWRDAHLPKVAAPTLFCSGTRDAFATPDELRQVAALMPDAFVHVLDGADHGFAVPTASGRTRQDVYDEAVNALVDWLAK
jgi:predicted alpha/beta-hydrolase family hydrolase